MVNPSNIEGKELKWMHQLNTFQPIGINIEYPFGTPFFTTEIIVFKNLKMFLLI